MKDLILIRIGGEDKPGITSAITAILAEYNVEILDIAQSVIHDNLSLGILIRIPPESESAPVLKDLLFTAYKQNIGIKFTPIDLDRYEEWVSRQDRQRFIVTVLGRKISSRVVGEVSRVMAVHDLNIAFVNRLSERISLKNNDSGGKRSSIEFSVRGTPKDISDLRRDFLRISAELGVDIAFQEDNVFRRNRRLVAFDMDSTLIQGEAIDELAKAAGVGDQVAEITARAMRGELDFQESLKARLALLKGLDQGALETIAESIPLTPGAERLITNLKRLGYTTAVISGGFTYFGKKLQERLGVDYLHANELEIVDGKLTGRVLGPIVDGAKKAEILKEIAEKEKISLQQVIAVGDGANDLPMLNLAGLGIAFHAKPVVKEGAGQSLSAVGLDGILYLIGMRDRDTFG